MTYSYVNKVYGVDFKPGDRVRHTITKRVGVVRNVRGNPHYFKVRFDGDVAARNVHPEELMKEPT